jgi:lipopolysaccharide export system permease protein
VKIYRRDKAGRLIERIEAPSATYARGGGWTLNRPVIVRFNGEQVNVTPAATHELALAPAPPGRPGPVRRQPRADRRHGPPGAAERRRRPSGHLLRDPPAGRLRRTGGVLVMLLLSAPVALANFRSGQGAVLLTAAWRRA